MNSEGSSGYEVSLVRALKQGFSGAYDHIGYVILSSIACSAAALVIFELAALAAGQMNIAVKAVLPFALAGLAYAVCGAGVAYYAYLSAFDKHPAVADTFVGIKKLVLPSVSLFFVDGVITSALILGAVYFISKMALGGAYLAAGLLFCYLLLVWLILAVYHLPLLAAQLDTETGPKPFVIIRKSFLLALDNLSFTVGLFVVIIAIAVLCAIPKFIGMLVLFLGVISFVLNHALKELFKKYGIVPPESQPILDDQWHLPESWRKRGSEADEREE